MFTKGLPGDVQAAICWHGNPGNGSYGNLMFQALRELVAARLDEEGRAAWLRETAGLKSCRRKLMSRVNAKKNKQKLAIKHATIDALASENAALLARCKRGAGRDAEDEPSGTKRLRTTHAKEVQQLHDSLAAATAALERERKATKAFTQQLHDKLTAADAQTAALQSELKATVAIVARNHAGSQQHCAKMAREHVVLTAYNTALKGELAACVAGSAAGAEEASLELEAAAVREAHLESKLRAAQASAVAQHRVMLETVYHACFHACSATALTVLRAAGA